MKFSAKITWLTVFGITMGAFEAAVVVYLRELYYPHGFTFPLVAMPWRLVAVELGREVASLLMLAAVGALAGRRFWERFGAFVFCFGIWDLLYYVFLKIAIGWPVTLTDWDILFLIPYPWIGPVIAPVLIAVLMVVTGCLFTRRYDRGGQIRPDVYVWIGGLAGVAVLLFSFLRDTGATFGHTAPQPYGYVYLAVGLVLCMAALWRVMARRG